MDVFKIAKVTFFLRYNGSQILQNLALQKFEFLSFLSVEVRGFTQKIFSAESRTCDPMIFVRFSQHLGPLSHCAPLLIKKPQRAL